MMRVHPSPLMMSELHYARFTVALVDGEFDTAKRHLLSTYDVLWKADGPKDPESKRVGKRVETMLLDYGHLLE